MAEVTGLVLGALPVAIRLFGFAMAIHDTVFPIQDFGDDIKDLVSDFRTERQKFSNWGKGCDLAELAKYGPTELVNHDPGWEKEEYEVLLNALTRMLSCLAKAQVLINQYERAGTNTSSPGLRAGDTSISDFKLHMRGAGLEGLYSEIEKTLNEHQMSVANINSPSTFKKARCGLLQAEELKGLVETIRQLNIDLKEIRSPSREKAEDIADFRVPIEYPFLKNPTFFGRAEILKQMKEIFGTTSGTPLFRSKGRKIVTLHGIGGVGKSQICAEYARTCGRAYTAVFWITATTADEVRRTAIKAVGQITSHYTASLPNNNPVGPSSYRPAALALGFDRSPVEALKALSAAAETRVAIEVLRHWLSKEFNGGWLLIIDDYSITGGSDYDLNDILPTSDAGHVIVTTRNLCPTDQNPIRIPESIGEENGVLLLKALGCPDGRNQGGLLILSFTSRHSELLTGSDSCDKYACEIVSILDGFPFALRLAGAYAWGHSFERCAEELMDSSGSQFIFKDYDDFRKDSLGNIWGLSLSNLEENAQKMLHLLSFMGNDIPLALVERAEDRIMRYCMTDERKVIYDALADLKSLSLITEIPGERLGIHDLVSRWAQSQLKDAELQGIAEHAVSIVTSSLILDSDTRAPHEWEYERKIMSQIDRCYDIFQTRLAPGDAASAMDDETRSIACKLAKVYEYQSNAEKPEALYRRSLRDVEKGSETIEELRMMNYLGVNLTFQTGGGSWTDPLGDGSRANPLYWHECAYAGMKNLGFADNTPDAMETKKNMADFFARNCEPLKAIEKYSEILRVQETKFGEAGPQTLETRCSLGEALMAHGQIDEALRQLEKVRSAREENPKLGKDHPKTLGVVHFIAEIHESRGEYDKALLMYDRVERIREEILGKNHFSTIETAYSIGNIHMSWQRYAEALRYFRMALTGLEEIFGAGNNHSLTFAAQRGIADVLDLEGHYREALGEYRKLHCEYIGRYGAGGKISVWQLRAAVDIGRVLDRMGRYKTALQFLEETAQTMKKKEKDGELQNHFLTPASILGIGSVQENQGQYGKALESYTWVKDRCCAVRGEGHTTTLAAVCSIAGILNKQGKYVEALVQYDIAGAGQKKAVGDTHPATLEAVLGKAEVLQNMGKLRGSLALYRNVMDMLKEKENHQNHRRAQDMEAGIQHEQKYGHPMVLMAAYGMGRTLESEKKYVQAFQLYKNVQEGWESSLGGDHTWALTAALGSGRILQKQKNYREAHTIYDRILLEMKRDDHPLRNEQPLRSEHPLAYETACSKGSLLFEMNQYDDAKASYEEALGGLRRILDDDHPATLRAMQGKANVLEKEKNYGDALKLYRKVATGLHYRLGGQHPETIRSRKKVSSVQRRKNLGL